MRMREPLVEDIPTRRIPAGCTHDVALIGRQLGMTRLAARPRACRSDEDVRAAEACVRVDLRPATLAATVRRTASSSWGPALRELSPRSSADTIASVVSCPACSRAVSLRVKSWAMLATAAPMATVASKARMTKRRRRDMQSHCAWGGERPTGPAARRGQDRRRSVQSRGGVHLREEMCRRDTAGPLLHVHMHSDHQGALGVPREASGEPSRSHRPQERARRPRQDAPEEDAR